VSERLGAFAALRMPNFSLYFAGQLVSNTGTWFQNLAISLIVVSATQSASALAMVTVAQFGPMMLLGGFAGRLADSVRPRAILLVSSLLATVVTLGLAWAVSSNDLSLPLVFGLIAVSGSIHAFERVAAQALIFELVGARLLQNAVVLSTVYVSAARSIGPGLAGFAFLVFGPAACMLVNAASYFCAFIALLLVRATKLHPRPRPEGERVSSWQTVRQLRHNRPLVVLLVVNVIVTVAAMNMNVVLTSVVSLTFDGDAGALGSTHALNAVGAIVGGLLLARFRSIGVAMLVPACLAFGAVLAVNSAVPSLALFLAAAPLLGLGIGFYQGVLNSAAQAASPPHEIGRTMSLVTMGNYGVAPIGALSIGFLIDWTSGQTALAVGCFACLFSAALVYFAVVRPGTTEVNRIQST